MATESMVWPDVMGVGTEAIESLASYFHRLREANAGDAGEWLARINQPRPVRDIKLLKHGYVKSRLTIEWLLNNGAPPEIKHLSFCDTKWLVPHDFRSGRAWCPSCIQVNPTFERALWTFSSYKVCHTHHIELVDKCGSCGWKPKFPSSRTHIPCVCDECGELISACKDQPRCDPNPWLLFCAEEIAKWVEANQLGAEIEPPRPDLGVGDGQKPNNGAMQTILFWSWLTGRDIISGEPMRTPREWAAYMDVPASVGERFLIKNTPEVADKLTVIYRKTPLRTLRRKKPSSRKH